MTQQQLADAADVSIAFVGRLERGQAGPGIDIVAKLAGDEGPDRLRKDVGLPR